jgi:Fe-S cluster assembly protein SufD
MQKQFKDETMSNYETQQLQALDELLINQFEEENHLVTAYDIPKVTALREKHFKDFLTTGFPDSTHEKWRFSEIESMLEQQYVHALEPQITEKNIEELFRCEVHNFNTEIISLLNGWFHDSDSGLQTTSDGVVVGSFRAAMKAYPALFEKYYGEIAHSENNSFVSINTALVQDGVFIYVPDGVKASKTLQIIKLIDHNENNFVQNRNLIILGRNSHLSLMHCDDSINHFTSLVNTVTEIFVAENANFELYKLQNLNDQSGLVNSTFIKQEANSNIKTNTLTFNCGMIRNNIEVALDGKGAHADVLGLYLMDKQQHVDNQIRILHNQPNCTSNELFKGILDDEATAVFNGYIYVARDAQKTNAYQNNNNILLKPTATIDTMPFLEIYADDVKCSHGATIGQLDMEAMFYLRSRGISAANARLLLMYAFAADIIDNISIEPLRNRIDDMVKKRLRGELSVCEKCVLHCGSPEKEYNFEIDMSKL